MAIVNPAQIRPYGEIPPQERELAEALIFNRHENALPDLIAYFDANPEAAAESKEKSSPLEGLTPAERLTQRIIRRLKAGVEEDIEAVLAERPDAPKTQTAVEILNEVLLPAMKEVGDRFGAG